jgi:hypothetical protein
VLVKPNTLATIAIALCSAACRPPPATPTAPAADLTCPSTVPPELAPPIDQDLAFVLTGWGVQRYTCTSSGWTFVTPDADLFAEGVSGLVVHHFSGPTWIARDTSLLVATKLAEVTVDASAIPWLLMKVIKHAGAKDGVLAQITSIQRLETHGGLAPDAERCDAQRIGLGADVPYSARYAFYRTSAVPTHRCAGTAAETVAAQL